MKGVMTADEVREAHAEIDRLNEDSRRTRWRETDNDRSITDIRKRLDRSRALAIHDLHDRFIKGPATAREIAGD